MASKERWFHFRAKNFNIIFYLSPFSTLSTASCIGDPSNNKYRTLVMHEPYFKNALTFHEFS